MAGMRYRARIERADGSVHHVHAKEVFETNTGDRIIIETGGGGGYGDPLKRSTNEVFEDFLNRKISSEAAAKDYGVVLNADLYSVDDQATEKLRADIAKSRGPITWTFDRGPDGRE